MLRPPELPDLEERRQDVLRQVQHERLGARAGRMRRSGELARLWRRLATAVANLRPRREARPAVVAHSRLTTGGH